VATDFKAASRFYSPLVKNIAKEESIPVAELDSISGSGANGRVTKKDILSHIQHRKSVQTISFQQKSTAALVPASISAGDEIIQMDRMRKMIAERMVDSKRTAPHVTSFVEADVTNIVFWRNKMKNEFQNREGDSLTFTPIFIEAVVLAIKDYPMINIQVDGDRILKKKDINIGMAVALPSGNLIVPVIKNADQYNITGLAKVVNDLAKRARENKLKPDELTGGTYTISNVGSFGNVMGTPIIVQPQVGILAVGAIQKKPAVIETPYGDAIAIRHKMFLSHSYDHRVVDGSLGGSVVRRIADYLEKFDVTRSV
jgi:2-oxoglutarate dehydrogenase E2 component (dihydrolipoamide succinyltransferase)